MRAKRITPEQKDAAREYYGTLDGRDRYQASVFVSDAQSAYWDRLVDEKRAKCLAAGLEVR